MQRLKSSSSSCESWAASWASCSSNFRSLHLRIACSPPGFSLAATCGTHYSLPTSMKTVDHAAYSCSATTQVGCSASKQCTAASYGLPSLSISYFSLPCCTGLSAGAGPRTEVVPGTAEGYVSQVSASQAPKPRAHQDCTSLQVRRICQAWSGGSWSRKRREIVICICHWYWETAGYVV